MSLSQLPPAPLDLPPPAPEERRRSLELVERIRERIAAAGGVIPFTAYMDACLNEPGLGYYRAGARGVLPVGARGDFVTAPELSPALGRCLARQVRELLAAGGGDTVLELGAGTGSLARHLLETLTGEGAGRGPVRRYVILEPSPALRARQQEALAGLPVEWVETLEGLEIEGVVLANEVLDCLPVQVFRLDPEGAAGARAGHGAVPLGVTWREDEGAGGRFDWAPLPPDPELDAWLGGLLERTGHALPPGFRSERVPVLEGWLGALGSVLRRGACLLIDYGDDEHARYHPQRGGATLRCYREHRVHTDPFWYPGLQDLTASVDFSAVARAARGRGFDILGYTTQAWFLIGSGLEEVVAELEREHGGVGTRGHLLAMQGLRRLLMPGEMGEAVKVLALGRLHPPEHGGGGPAPEDERHGSGARPPPARDFVPSGFAARDWRGRL